MIKNMGSWDKTFRVIVALIAAVLIVTGIFSGLLAIVIGVLAAVFLLTGMIGTCPLYIPFGIRTNKSEEGQ